MKVFVSLLCVLALPLVFAYASIPAGKSDDEMVFAKNVFEVEEVYFFRDRYLADDELAKNTVEFGPLEFAHHKIAIKRLEEKVDEFLQELKFKNSPKIAFNQPTSAETSPRLEIQYILDSTKAEIHDEEVLLGSLTFSLTLRNIECLEDKVCMEGRTFVLNPESFIISDTLSYETKDIDPNIPEEVNAALTPEAKVTAISKSFENALEISTQQLKNYLRILLKLGAT